jgi:hypothetical protein
MANLADLNLLGGLISGTLLKSEVIAKMDANGNISFDTSGSQTVNLVVAGLPIQVNTGPNTTIDLNILGITGKVVLNEETTSSAGRVMTRRALHIVIDQPDLLRNLLGVKPLTNVEIATARAGFTKSRQSVQAHAYGSKVTVGSLLRLGPSARIGMPCKGTEDSKGVVQTLTNTLVHINLPPILTLGLMDTSVAGTGDDNGKAWAKATAQVLHLNLLGLVQADALRSVAYAEKSNGTITLDTKSPDGDTTKFLTLVVLGNPITLDVGPNTKVSIPGLATLWLNRVIKTSTSIEVRALDLSVLKNNPLGVLLGTTVRLGVAHAGVG